MFSLAYLQPKSFNILSKYKNKTNNTQLVPLTNRIRRVATVHIYSCNVEFDNDRGLVKIVVIWISRATMQP